MLKELPNVLSLSETVFPFNLSMTNCCRNEILYCWLLRNKLGSYLCKLRFSELKIHEMPYTLVFS